MNVSYGGKLRKTLAFILQPIDLLDDDTSPCLCVSVVNSRVLVEINALHFNLASSARNFMERPAISSFLR